MKLFKSNPESSEWCPLEAGRLVVAHPQAARILISDALRREYLSLAVRPGMDVPFVARGAAGAHLVELRNAAGERLAFTRFTLRAETRFACDRGPYAALAGRIAQLLACNAEQKPFLINGKIYRMFVCWGRDHVHTLKAMKYLANDVKSGLEYWLETQEPDGMLWDCVYPNTNYPAPTWFGEALGPGYYRYDDGMKFIVRRIPVEADCEFLYTEGVWYVWKATGDDAWMAKQLPVLERALTYNNSSPARWSARHGLVRRSMCQDSWDFVNPLYCNGDHRCINPGDPQFLFHSDNSGLYASYWRMAEMYEALGQLPRAKALRAEGEALRKRANAKLFFDPVYGHMIPEELPEAEVYAKVGDERQRMSLSTGYTINRKMPTHEMAVKIIREYRRRYQEKRHESFAEWWTMDPPYEPAQWPGDANTACPVGEYMNGAICTIIAGELAKAAFEHGEEAYGADILERVWLLSERDGGELFQAYRRLPEQPQLPQANFQTVDLRRVVNRGLQNGAHPGVVAWTDEGDNDLRGLPVGRHAFGSIPFDVADPATNQGRGVLFVPASSPAAPLTVRIPTPALSARSLYFLHVANGYGGTGEVAGTYDVAYADGHVVRIYLRLGHELSTWWGVSDQHLNPAVTRVAWRGANPTWKNVGIFMYGWNNPRPEVPITGISATAAPAANARAGLFLAGLTVSDQPVAYDVPIRSYGLPDSWAQAAVFYAVAEGLAGIEDTGRAFDRVRVAPRWAASQAGTAEVTLHYPASDGYCTCRHSDDGQGCITLELTGSFEHAEVHCLLPGGKRASCVTVAGAEVAFANVCVEASNYVDFTLDQLPRGPLAIAYDAADAARGDAGVD